MPKFFNMLKNIILVFVGGAFGSTGRFIISKLLAKYNDLLGGFPVSTMTANFVGCLCIGLIIGYLSKNPSNTIQHLLVTGFCGGFTTFSTFSSEIISFLQSGQTATALLYIFISIVICIAATFLGMLITR